MSHVQLTAGVGEHGEAVEFLPLRVFCGLETLVLFPIGLGLCLNLCRVECFLHCCWSEKLKL